MKKFGILWIVIMALFGSMVMTGCKNDDVFTNINSRWEEDEYKVIEEKYRGTWETISDSNGDFHSIRFDENQCWSGYNNIYSSSPTSYYHAIAYTEGAKLYLSGSTFEREIFGEFTSDTTFRPTGDTGSRDFPGIEYHKK
jgi:hypothetical protein